MKKSDILDLQNAISEEKRHRESSDRHTRRELRRDVFIARKKIRNLKSAMVLSTIVSGIWFLFFK